MTPIEEAAQQGYSQEEVQTYLSEKSHAAKEAGYSDQEIQSYVKDTVLQQPDFNKTPLKAMAHRNLAARPGPTTFLEALETGYDWSVSGLGQEMLKSEGHLPAMATNEETPLWLQATAGLASVVGDSPAIVAGGVLGGGIASPITAWAGGVALPQGIRKVFMDALEQRETGITKDFADRATGAIWETLKGMAVGAVTGAVGKYATASTGALGPVAKWLLPTVAENAAMTEMSARLEGHAPTPESFVVNGAILGVMKGVLPSWAAKPPKILSDIYVKTGIPPEKVTNDALKDSSVWQDTLDGRVPDAYKEHVEQPPSTPTQAQRTEGVKPPLLTPEQTAQTKAFLEQPFAEIPQMPNEPARPTHVNYNYQDTTESIQQMESGLSTYYLDKMKAQQGGPITWKRSNQEAAKVLADVLQSNPETVMAFVKGEEPGPSVTAKLLARKELSVRAVEDLARKRAAFMAKGDTATPRDLAVILAQVETISSIQAGFIGRRADVMRAANALKSTAGLIEQTQGIIDAVTSYGGDKNVAKLMKMLGEYDNPAQMMAFASKMTKATTWDMVVEAWKAGLVSGLRTHEVNFLSTAAFTTLRLPIEAIAATFGAMRNEGERVSFAEIPARVIGMAMGTRDGAKLAGAILRTGENLYGPKTDQYAPAIPGLTGEIVRIPFRFLSAEDAILKVVNERGELYALATRQALVEGQTFGTPAFFERTVDIARNPTPEMQTQAAEAAARYTFNMPLGPKGRAFQHLVKTAKLEWLFPFTSTPGNIFKETARMTPGLNLLVREWREDYQAGGIRRDRALAEVTVGTLVMTTVFAAASEGLITGNGTPDKRVKATEMAANIKPYAFKLHGRYVDGYLRMAPLGPMIGATADMYEMWQYMTEGERDQLPKMIGFAIAKNVTGQSFFAGPTNLMSMLDDPARYGENYFESVVSSVVPAIIGQTAGDVDPYIREVHGMLDALRARIPLMRQGLMPKKDLFGVPIPSPEHLWPGSPFSISPQFTDKVRTEAARLHFATPEIPKSLDVIPGTDFGKIDKIQLTSEQKDMFATTSGQMAYNIIQQEVVKPDWDSRSPYEQRRLFEMAFKHSRVMAEKLALEQAFKTQQDEIQQKQQKALETTKRKTP